MNMSSRILKYPLDVQRRQIIEVPAGSFVTHVREQFDVVCIWTIRPAGMLLLHKWQVTCLSTGDSIPEDAGDYAGTAHIHDGRTIVHVFINKEPKQC
jgi:hypothetical protein